MLCLRCERRCRQLPVYLEAWNSTNYGYRWLRKTIRPMPANRNFTAVPQQSMAEERIERSKSKKMAAGAKFTARKARKERLPSRMSQAPIDRDTSVLFPKMQMEEELQWLPDPFRLAEHVAELLQSPRAIDHLKALALTRQASRRGQVVVSWNHLIDWNMGHGHAQEAVKLFQEVCYL